MEELMSNAQPDGRPRIGRAPATTHGELSHLALALFLERGFEQTTVDDIVEAAGIGRRTFFRYFRSKNDLPWGDFDQLLRQMRDYLTALPGDVPLRDALRSAVITRFALDVPPAMRRPRKCRCGKEIDLPARIGRDQKERAVIAEEERAWLVHRYTCIKAGGARTTHPLGVVIVSNDASRKQTVEIGLASAGINVLRRAPCAHLPIAEWAAASPLRNPDVWRRASTRRSRHGARLVSNVGVSRCHGGPWGSVGKHHVHRRRGAGRLVRVELQHDRRAHRRRSAAHLALAARMRDAGRGASLLGV